MFGNSEKKRIKQEIAMIKRDMQPYAKGYGALRRELKRLKRELRSL